LTRDILDAVTALYAWVDDRDEVATCAPDRGRIKWP